MLLVLIKKFLGKNHSIKQGDSNFVEMKVLQIQQGDVNLRNELIMNYQPYVSKLTSQFAKGILIAGLMMNLVLLLVLLMKRLITFP